MNEFTIQEIRAVYQEKKVETYGDLKKVTSSHQIGLWLEKEIGSFTQEHLVSVYLNVKNEVICFSVVHIGTIDQSIHTQEIFFKGLYLQTQQESSLLTIIQVEILHRVKRINFLQKG